MRSKAHRDEALHRVTFAFSALRLKTNRLRRDVANQRSVFVRLDDEFSDRLDFFAGKGQTAPSIHIFFANDLLQRDILELCSYVKLRFGLKDVDRARKQLLVN